MKKFYTLMAAAIAMASFSSVARAADEQDVSNLTILWNKVEVAPVGSTADVTVTARLRVADGKTFTGTVYPVIESDTQYIDYGQGNPQQVTLPTASRSYQTDMLTWTFTAQQAWSQDPAATMYCILYYRDSIGKAVEIGRVKVRHSGTTGITDAILADDGVTEVFTTGGVRVARGSNVDLHSLRPGMYIVRTGSVVSKVVL